MIRKKINLLLLGFLLFTFSYAQTRTLSGRVTSPGVSEGLTGAGISVFEFSSGKNLYQGISGQDGSFTISGLPAVKIIIEVSFLGYKSLKEETDLSAGDISNYLLTLEPAVLEMGEVIVSSLRQDKMLRDVSLPLAVVNSADIGNSPAITPADLFTSVPGVNMARDGIWATSMNIRGLSEQRIVTLVDGNRIETASDVAAGMAMIDLNDIERVEVIKGAASSLYGTGAMGGVVNIITREGHYSEGLKANGSLAGIYQTVNKMHSENMELTLSDDKWYTRISGTLRDAQNTMTPAGELLNSQFSDNNLSLKAGVKPLKNHEFTLNYQRFSAQDVGIPGGSAFPATATATYPDELRSMLAATYSIKPRGKSLGLISFKYFHQYIVRDVELKPNAAVTITPSGYHTTNGFQLQSDWNIKENHQLIAGIDLWQRYLTTEREKTIRSAISDSLGNIIGENITIRGEIPIPDAWFTSGGVFVQDQISLLQNKLSLSLGGRADLINTQNDQAKDPVYLMVNGVRNDNPPKQRITFEANNQNNYSWSLDAGLLFHMTAKSDLSLSLSKAYRAPSIEERFKYIDLGSLVKLGDPKLKPEEGYSADLGLRIWTNKFRFNASVFGNRMTNLIVEIPGEFIYNYSADPDNYDTISALINTNINKSLLYGLDMAAAYNFFGGFTLRASLAYVRGLDTGNESDLPLIPPINGSLSLTYRLSENFKSEVTANLVGKQDKIAGGEMPTSAYATYDAGLNGTVFKSRIIRLEGSAGIQNITDRAYMNHLSTNRGIIKYEPGRNIYLKMRVYF